MKTNPTYHEDDPLKEWADSEKVWDEDAIDRYDKSISAPSVPSMIRPALLVASLVVLGLLIIW